MTTDDQDVPAVERQELIAKLESEAAHCASANSYGRDVLAPLMRYAAEFINSEQRELLNTQPVVPATLVRLADVEVLWNQWRMTLGAGAFTHSDGLRFMKQLHALPAVPAVERPKAKGAAYEHCDGSTRADVDTRPSAIASDATPLEHRRERDSLSGEGDGDHRQSPASSPRARVRPDAGRSRQSSLGIDVRALARDLEFAIDVTESRETILARFEEAIHRAIQLAAVPAVERIGPSERDVRYIEVSEYWLNRHGITVRSLARELSQVIGRLVDEATKPLHSQIEALSLSGTPEGLCTRCSATQYCAEHEPPAVVDVERPDEAAANQCPRCQSAGTRQIPELFGAGWRWYCDACKNLWSAPPMSPRPPI